MPKHGGIYMWTGSGYMFASAAMAPHMGGDLGASFTFSFSSVGWHVDLSRASAHHRGYLFVLDYYYARSAGIRGHTHHHTLGVNLGTFRR